MMSEMEVRETRYRGSRSTFTEGRSSSGSLNEFELPSHAYSSKKKGVRRGDDQECFFTLMAVLLYILGLCMWIRYIDYRVPIPLTVADIKNNPSSFIEERARNDLLTLSSGGPRVAGSYVNDITTVEALKRIVEDIKRTMVTGHKIEIDIQKPVGSFHMTFQDQMTSSYSKIPNMIVKFEPANRKGSDSILVNCHFDTAPGSPGASDDMSACVVMLEALRVLSREPVPLNNTIIFLFNGAEENFLQGSHGFIKGRVEGVQEEGHQWARNLKCFLNLESAGTGAREILFQTGPGNGWLLDSYKKVPYPWGSVVGEEIFQKGLIPSDTDFRIFRDFANIPGLDMAFVKNGYFYHTKFDSVDHFTPGSLQHEGSNVLSLLQSLGNTDFNQVKYSDSKTIFFDVFGYFVVVYSENAAVMLNLLVGLIVLTVAWREMEGQIKTMVWQVFATVAAWVSGIALALIVGLVLNVLGILSPYHSYPVSLPFLLFGTPTMLGQVLMYSLTLKGSEDHVWMAGKISLAILLIVSTLFTRVVFSTAFNLIFGFIGWYAARLLFKGYRTRLGFYLVVGETFPLCLSLYLISGCLDTFVPIMGRSGSDSNPNLFVAGLTAITLTLPTMSGIVPIFVFFKKTFFKCALAVMLIVTVFIVLMIGRIPYQDKTPMRIHLIEVDRTYYDVDLTTIKKRDAGFWLFNVDPNIPKMYDILGEGIPQLRHENHEEIDALSCEDLNCGLPYILPVKKLIRRTHWLPKPNGLPAALTERVRMDITEDSWIANDVRRVSFSFIGSTHLTINFSPGRNYEITRWSLTEEVPAPLSILWKGRPTYFVYHARGVLFERFNVTVHFRRKTHLPDTTDPLVDINFSSFYLHGDEMKSQEMLDFILPLPSWTYVLGFSGVSQVYSIPA